MFYKAHGGTVLDVFLYKELELLILDFHISLFVRYEHISTIVHNDNFIIQKIVRLAYHVIPNDKQVFLVTTDQLEFVQNINCKIWGGNKVTYFIKIA